MMAVAATNVSQRLVRCLLQMRAAGLPENIIRQTELHIADATAIGWAATACEPIAGQLTQAMWMGVKGYGGACRVFGLSHRLPPALAAFSNAALIHTLDFDDIHDAARLHPTAVTLPAALAAAELNGASMQSVVEAVALGNELMCRLGVMYLPQGSGPGSDWFLTQLFGYFGAAVSAGLVLGLDEARLVSSLGFAYMQAAGGKEAGFGVGATGRSIYPAFAAMGGMTAAQLACAGMLGPASALDGAANLFRIYLQGDPAEEQLKTLLDPANWAFVETRIKPWPCCRLSHPYVAAALALRSRLEGDSIVQLRVAVNASAAKLCKPIQERRRPTTLQDAKYSIPFMTAYALVHGGVELDGLQLDRLNEPDVQAVADRIVIEETLPDRAGHPPARLHATTSSGRELVSEAPSFDLDEAGIRSKFLQCFAYAGLADKAEAACRALESMATHNDVSVLLDADVWRPS